MIILLIILAIILIWIFFSVIVHGFAAIGIFIAVLFGAGKELKAQHDAQPVADKGPSFKSRLAANWAANDAKYKSAREAKQAAAKARKEPKV